MKINSKDRIRENDANFKRADEMKLKEANETLADREASFSVMESAQQMRVV